MSSTDQDTTIQAAPESEFTLTGQTYVVQAGGFRVTVESTEEDLTGLAELNEHQRAHLVESIISAIGSTTVAAKIAPETLCVSSPAFLGLSMEQFALAHEVEAAQASQVPPLDGLLSKGPEPSFATAESGLPPEIISLLATLVGLDSPTALGGPDDLDDPGGHINFDYE